VSGGLPASKRTGQVEITTDKAAALTPVGLSQISTVGTTQSIAGYEWLVLTKTLQPR
jgi:hypothetical protein